MENINVKQQFDRFRNRSDTFSLGVCNGCQLLTKLGWVPGKFIKNKSGTKKKCIFFDNCPKITVGFLGRFESRFVTVTSRYDTSIMLNNMSNCRLGTPIC